MKSDLREPPATGDEGLPETDRRSLRSYTAMAANYDATRFSSPRRRMYAELANEVIAGLIRCGPDIRVLDVATGTGRLSRHFASLGARVVGVDLTAAMLSVAQGKVDGAATGKLMLNVANARQLPFGDESFDAVTAIRFFHLLPPAAQQEILAEMYRVVRPGGRVVVEFNNRYSAGPLRPIMDLVGRVKSRSYRRGSVSPIALRGVIGSLPVLRRRGLWFLGHGHLGQLSMPLARAADGLSTRFPFYYLTEQLLVVIEKLRIE